MKCPSNNELIHLKIQAAMREHSFPEDQMKYLGVRAGHHWYLVAGEYEVRAEEIEAFDRVDEEE
jgi:hypothetical protein